MGQLRMGGLLDGNVCSRRLRAIFNYIGCRDKKWGMNKDNETKSDEEEDWKGETHNDETQRGMWCTGEETEDGRRGAVD